MSLEFLHNMNGIPPEAVVKMTLVEDIIDPMFFAEPLLPWENCTVQHPGIDLVNR